MRHGVALVLLLTVPITCYGQGLTITGASTHYGSEGPKTEINPGVIQTLPASVQPFGIAIRPSMGVMINSVGQVSVLLGGESSYELVEDHVEISARLGLATGYSGLVWVDSPQGIIPMTSQSLRVGTKHLKLELIHLPSAFGIGIRLSP